MSPIRRIINLVCALTLTLGGGAIVIFLLLFAHGWRGWMVMAGGSMLAGGACWLWADFINATPNEEA